MNTDPVAFPTPEQPSVALPACGVLAVLGICFWAAFSSLSETLPTRRSSTGHEPRVRIALIESALRVEVALDADWVIEPDRGDSLVLESPDRVVVRAVGGGLVIEGDHISLGYPEATDVVLRPLVPSAPEAPFGLAGRQYRGRLRVVRLAGSGLRAINSVGIEDYLAGVIGHEMPLRWSDTALHVQAIAARTYALVNRHPEKDHDLKADTRSQVYAGLLKEDERARRLVDETRGQVVTFEGEMVNTYFHSTCGGDTVPAHWIFPWVKEESLPLSGATDCTCQPSRLYRWTERVETARFARLPLKLPLRSVSVEHWPRGHYVKTLTLRGDDGKELVLEGWDARRVFGLKGYAFDAELDEGGEHLTFRGRGWGHGVGMCQFGAEGFSQQGKTTEWILGHFYPGTRVTTLY